MRASALVLVIMLGCSGSRATTPAAGSAASEPAPPVEAAHSAAPLPVVADAPAPPDAPAPDAPASKLHYVSDCSLSNPIARDPCSGAEPSKRGLQTCAARGVKRGDPCRDGAPSCYVETTCADGRKVPSQYLVCADRTPERCFTRSSRRYKTDVQYLAPDELRDLARRIEALRVARYRYKDQDTPRLGFLTEDAPGAPFVTDDGRMVDLYALLAASIAAIQAQDERIRALEQQVQQCPK